MKTTLTLTFAALLAAAIAVPVLAQPGPGNGQGMGYGQGPRATGQSTPANGGGMGMGRGGMNHGNMRGGRAGQGMRGMQFGQSNTAGWTLMTPEERTAHQTRMRAVTTVDECTKVRDEQHKLVEARAKEKGVTLPAPRQNACENMKARGFIK